MTLLADVVTASRRVAGTSSRSQKVAILADLLRRLDAEEIPIVVGLLSGIPRQGRVGVGYSTVYGLEHASAVDPTLTVEGVDRAIVDVSRRPAPAPRRGGSRSSATCSAGPPTRRPGS
jgi:DNA ligase-1